MPIKASRVLIFQIKELIFEMIIRVFVLSVLTVTLGLSVAAGCSVRQLGGPIALAVLAGVLATIVLVGIVYLQIVTWVLHPCKPHVFYFDQAGFCMWLTYLQACYFSQMYTIGLLNGSWLRALFERLNGADTPLNAQWYINAIRDHPLLKVGNNAVLDYGSYLVGHSGQADGTLRFAKSGIGDEAVLHPYAILLDGQSLGDRSTLDIQGHSHLESFLKANTFWAQSPARPERDARVNVLAEGLREDQRGQEAGEA